MLALTHLPRRRICVSTCHLFGQFRSLCASSIRLANRALVYASTGQPATVLFSTTFPSLQVPAPNTVNVKFLLSPINPADLNVIEGVYPKRPSPSTSLSRHGIGSIDQPVYVAGNEGLGEVTAVGSGVTGLRTGDWVIMTKQQAGTWISNANLAVGDILKLPHPEGRHRLTQVHGATMTINPPTAYNMLLSFAELKEGDWVVQNGANSSVGQAVIQIAAWRGVKTINFVRSRPDIEALRKQLMDLGAHHVLTYEALLDKSTRKLINEWTRGKDPQLGLNCVGGKETSLMAALLGRDAHLVTYGAMSKQPLSLPTSLLIFKNLTCHGFWLSRWYEEANPDTRREMMKTLVHLAVEGKLREPEHQIVVLGARETDKEITQKMRDIFLNVGNGRYGKKILLRIEEAA